MKLANKLYANELAYLATGVSPQHRSVVAFCLPKRMSKEHRITVVTE